MSKKLYITGLYGCSCHPFKSWEDHDYYAKQKFKKEDSVRVGHTGIFAYIIKKKTQGNYYDINKFPCANPSDIGFDHVTNLISFNNFTSKQKKAFTDLLRSQK